MPTGWWSTTAASSLSSPRGVQPGSINLGHMVEGGKVDWEKIRLTTGWPCASSTTRRREPLPSPRSRWSLTRKIGLGVMGWADMLFQLRIPYDSEEALTWAGASWGP